MTSSFNIHVDNNLTFSNDADATLSVAATDSGAAGKALTITAGSTPAASGNTNGGNLILKSGLADGTGSSIIGFHTSTATSDNAVAERMRIHTNGYVGIGETEPGAKLHIKESTLNASAITIDDGTSWLKFVPNLGSGAYNGISVAGDIGIIFSTDNDNTSDAATGLVIACHSQTAGGIRIKENGNVGIGTSSPAYPLDISGHSTTQSPSGTVWGYYLATGGVSVVGSPWNTYNHNVSCKATGEFIGSQFTTYSDSRIKKNIVELIDDEALLKFRQLKPCKYNYIDTLNRGEDTVYGFIAQEVKEVADYAVKILTTGEFIPNVYQSAIYNDTVITFQELHNLTTNGNIKLNLPSNTDITCPYTVVDTLTLNIDISNLSSGDIPSNDFQYAEDGTQLTYNIFVYGTEVNDFHVLDKNTIWTTTASALQEIDRIQQDAIIQINAEKTKTVTLETQVADLLARMTALENP